MQGENARRSEEFLRRYRILEGLLEKRYASEKNAVGSVVMEYLRDADSVPCRTELDLCREIRNLLTHNSDSLGEAVVEPSQAVLDMLENVINHVRRPRMAVDYGTPRDNIFFARSQDLVLDTMRRMQRMGYSHVPVLERGGLAGVFSAGCLQNYLAQNGFDGLHDDLRMSQLKKALAIDSQRNEKYAFMPGNTTVYAVREAFEHRGQRNNRLAAVFITEDGTPEGLICAMLTPWDVLRDGVLDDREEDNGR